MERLRLRTPEDYLYIAIGSALGLGLSPFFPGTCGALLGVVFHSLIVSFLPASVQWTALMVVFILVCLANHLLTPWAVEYWQSPDPKHFVLDEVAGYLFVQIVFRQDGQFWKIAGLGFILFRIFDIFKLIPPTKYIDQNIHGAWGILLDDLVSAGYAALLMYIISLVYPQWSK
ncbi:MAG: MarR family transcriptional regulator [Desulfobacteraceae bacterium IS3]|jgi:phosphatidylglycerophosphatase A|nr:MAG: MarR family transcriptional regulator [Desulfobacteraceae bacterium IS3]HAO20869.1 phosphatidylglycerophosphatase A [Desulfobacteraceae bacterium]